MLLSRRRNGAQPGPGRIQTRIMLAMLLSSALVAPIVVLSLFYIGQINQLLGRIVNTDIELIRLADDITVTFLDTRRSEKNFLLYRDTTYLSAARAGADRVDTLCSKGRALDPEIAAQFDSVSRDVARYRRQLDTLAGLLEPGSNVAYPQALLRLRAEHQRLLDLAETTTDSLRRDSALAAAERLSAERELPVTGLIGRVLNDQLRSTETRMTFHAAAIGSYAAARTGESRARAQQLSVWGQRNIATVLLLVVVVLIWVVISLPRGLVLPLKRIANALGRAERGDLSAHVKVHGRDELDQLARQLNRVFTRIRENDDRKTGYIQLLEHRFRLLAADIAEGVLVFDRTPNLVYANTAVESLLGRPASEARGHALSEFPGLAFLTDPLEDTLSGSGGHQECGILPGLPSSAVCIEALRDNTGAVVGALVVITNPQPPAPEEPAEPEPAS
jgi:nitrogen fixation/metabolism regulation signal transduction histidine kinase